MDQRFDAMDLRFDAMDLRFDAMDQRFDAMDQRFGAMDQRFGAVERQFGTMELRFDATDRKIDEKFEESKRYFGVLVERLESMVGLIAEGHRSVSSRDGVGAPVGELVKRPGRRRYGARSSRGRSAAS